MKTIEMESDKSMNTHSALMVELAGRHDVLLPLLEGRPIHFLDLPFHGNVGDLLIMQGTLRFLQKHKLPIARLGMYFNYSSGWAKPGDVIAFHGGGNFGDMYGPFQAFRERVIAALPKNRIVLFPQSMHFSDPEKFRQCCEALSRHPDLHICVRDTESEKMARQMTPHVYLLPDMAHQLWPIARPCPASHPLLQLRRRDSEARSPLKVVGNTFDWDDLVGKNWTFFLSQIAERSMYHAHRFGLNKPFANLEGRLWIAQSERFVQRAVKLFASHERVESDRLHAHILSCLLSIPNRIDDNSYGKNGRYIAAWTSASPLLTLEQPLASAA
jgi:pyruvyl transferase EpsO